MYVTYPPNNKGNTPIFHELPEPFGLQTLHSASTEPPVDPDMPKLESEDELTPPVMICWAVVKQYRTVMASIHEWMIRLAECEPRVARRVPVWKETFDTIVARIGEIEKVVYDDSDASAKMLGPLMTALSFGKEVLHRDIFAALGDATDRPAGSSRDALFRLAFDDVALRALGYLSIAQLLCEEFELPTRTPDPAILLVNFSRHKRPAIGFRCLQCGQCFAIDGDPVTEAQARERLSHHRDKLGRLLCHRCSSPRKSSPCALAVQQKRICWKASEETDVV